MNVRFDLAVLGSPVSHSLSPVMHEAGLRALGLSGRYTAIDVDEEGMRRHAAMVRDGTLTGANITMPHKRIAAELSDELTETADRAAPSTPGTCEMVACSATPATCKECAM